MNAVAHYYGHPYDLLRSQAHGPCHSDNNGTTRKMVIEEQTTSHDVHVDHGVTLEHAMLGLGNSKCRDQWSAGSWGLVRAYGLGVTCLGFAWARLEQPQPTFPCIHVTLARLNPNHGS